MRRFRKFFRGWGFKGNLLFEVNLKKLYFLGGGGLDFLNFFLNLYMKCKFL